jgi:hypothetical protein
MTATAPTIERTTGLASARDVKELLVSLGFKAGDVDTLSQSDAKNSLAHKMVEEIDIKLAQKGITQEDKTSSASIGTMMVRGLLGSGTSPTVAHDLDLKLALNRIEKAAGNEPRYDVSDANAETVKYLSERTQYYYANVPEAGATLISDVSNQPAPSLPWMKSQQEAARKLEQRKQKALDDVDVLINRDYRKDGGLDARYKNFLTTCKDTTDAKGKFIAFAKQEADRFIKTFREDKNSAFQALSEKEQQEVVIKELAKRLDFHRGRRLSKEIAGSIEQELKQTLTAQYEKESAARKEADTQKPQEGRKLESALTSDAQQSIQVPADNASAIQTSINERKAAEQKIADLAPGVLAEHLPSTAPHFKAASDKIISVKDQIKLATNARIAAEQAELKAKQDVVKKLITDIKALKEFSDPSVKDTALIATMKGIEERVAKNDFNPVDTFNQLLEATHNDRDANTKVGSTTNPEGKKVEVRCMPFGTPKTILLLSMLGASNKPGLLKNALSAVSAAEQATADAKDKELTAENDAVSQIKSELTSALQAQAKQDAQAGDYRLQYALEHTQTVRRNGRDEIVYAILTKEQASHYYDALGTGYRNALNPIHTQVETEINALNDPLINKALASAKLRDDRLKRGINTELFTGINEKQLDTYIENERAKAFANLKGSQRKDAEVTFQKREKLLRAAAGYINFNYARSIIEDQISLTGREAMEIAHRKTAADRKIPIDKAVDLTSGSVREVESLSTGAKESWRHQQGRHYGPAEIQKNYDAQIKKGLWGLEAYDIAVSDTAGKALGEYTSGMQRIQQNLNGFIYKNANTEGLLQVGFFFAGQWVGNQLFGNSLNLFGKSGSSGTGGGGSGNSN